MRQLEVDVSHPATQTCAAQSTADRKDRPDRRRRPLHQAGPARSPESTRPRSEANLNGKLKDVPLAIARPSRSRPRRSRSCATTRPPQPCIDLAAEAWHVARDAQQMEIVAAQRARSTTRGASALLGMPLRGRDRHGHAGRDSPNGAKRCSDLVDELRRSPAFARTADRMHPRLEQAKIIQRMRDNEDPGVKKWGDFECAQWQELREVCETHLVQLKVNERWGEPILRRIGRPARSRKMRRRGPRSPPSSSPRLCNMKSSKSTTSRSRSARS